MAPEECKAGHIQAEHVPEADTAPSAALRVGHARGGGAAVREGDAEGSARRRAGKRRDSGVGKPVAPDESKAEHIQAERPTRGLVRWPGEGTRPKNPNMI